MTCSSGDMFLDRQTNRQTDRQTDTFITILCTHIRSGVINKQTTILQRNTNANSTVSKLCLPSVLWRCWLGGRKGIRPVKNWVVRCWHGYLSGARCRLECGPDDATAGALKTQVRNSAFRKDGKRMYGKRKYESAWVENASTENASTMQTFSQIKKVWYFTS